MIPHYINSVNGQRGAGTTLLFIQLLNKFEPQYHSLCEVTGQAFPYLNFVSYGVGVYSVEPMKNHL